MDCISLQNTLQQLTFLDGTYRRACRLCKLTLFLLSLYLYAWANTFPVVFAQDEQPAATPLQEPSPSNESIPFGSSQQAPSVENPAEQQAEDEQVPEPPRLTAEETMRMIRQLGSNRFEERDTAYQRLILEGKSFEEMLDQLAEQVSSARKDPEIDWRIRDILGILHRPPLVGYEWQISFPNKPDNVSLTAKNLNFLEDGTFTYQGGGSRTAWSFEKETLKFSYNGGYATYVGKFVDAETIEGKADNIKGKSWHWRLQRIK
jgi:hypothetical protein